MQVGRASGLGIFAAFAIASGCATAPPFEGTLTDDGGGGGDDAAATLDSGHGHDSAPGQDSGGTGNDASPGMDASTGMDTGTAADSGAVDTGTSVDTGTPDTSTMPDTGTTGCSPQSVSGYSPRFVSPLPRSTVCTAAASNALYNGCLAATATQATCTTARTQYAACFNCVFTPDTATTWGPVIEVSNGTVRVNEGGCVQLADGSQASCARAIQASDGCDDMACKAACMVTDQASFMAYQACVTSAESGGCATYANASLACKSAIPSSSAAFNCVNGASFQALYNQIVPVFCGP